VLRQRLLGLAVEKRVNRVLDRLWIGDARDLRSPLQKLGFSAVLDLRDSSVGSPDDVAVLKIHNRDGDPWSVPQVHEAIGFIDAYIRQSKVLVVCAAGMSRSASMVIGYLVRGGWDEASAFEAVRNARPKIAPVPAMLESVLVAVRS
jgi:predicted protein tyrosine phosphatase